MAPAPGAKARAREFCARAGKRRAARRFTRRACAWRATRGAFCPRAKWARCGARRSRRFCKSAAPPCQCRWRRRAGRPPARDAAEKDVGRALFFGCAAAPRPSRRGSSAPCGASRCRWRAGATCRRRCVRALGWSCRAPRSAAGGRRARRCGRGKGGRVRGLCGAEPLRISEILRGLRAMGGFGLNVANPLAAREYLGAGLCAVTAGIETPCAEMAAVAGAGRWRRCVRAHAADAHARLPLTERAHLQGLPREGKLLDRKGLYFPVRCTGPDGVRTVFNPVPLYAADRAGEVPADELELYFTIEDAAARARGAAHGAGGRGVRRAADTRAFVPPQGRMLTNETEDQKLREDAQLPAYATPGAAAMDLVAACGGRGRRAGADAARGDPHGHRHRAAGAGVHGAGVDARSSMGAKRGIALSNGVGVIDSDYRGEIGVAVVNLSGERAVIAKGELYVYLLSCPWRAPRSNRRRRWPTLSAARGASAPPGAFDAPFSG